MKCPSEVELNEFAEDRLATQRRWEVEQHLQDCPGCRTDLEGLSWATEALDALLEEDVAEASHPDPESLAALRDGTLAPLQRAEVISHLSVCAECARTFGQLPQEKREVPMKRHWQPLVAAASLLLVVGLVFFARDQFTPNAALPPPTVREAPSHAPADKAAVAEAPAAPTDGKAAPQSAASDVTTPAAPPTSHAAPEPSAGRGGKAGPTKVLAAGAGPQVAGTRPERPKRTRPTVVATAPPLGTRPVLPTRNKAESDHQPKRGGRMGVLSIGSHTGSAEVRTAPAPPPAPAAAEPSDDGVRSGPTRRVEGARPPRRNALTPQQLLAQKAKDWPVGQPAVVAPTGPGMPGMPAAAPPAAMPGAPAPAATAAGMAPGGAGVGTQPQAELALTNQQLMDRRWLLSLRNDPVRKAQIKAWLQRELKTEPSGQRRELLKAALLTLDTPLASAPKAGGAKTKASTAMHAVVRVRTKPGRLARIAAPSASPAKRAAKPQAGRTAAQTKAPVVKTAQGKAKPSARVVSKPQTPRVATKGKAPAAKVAASRPKQASKVAAKPQARRLVLVSAQARRPGPTVARSQPQPARKAAIRGKATPRPQVEPRRHTAPRSHAAASPARTSR